MKPLIVTPVKEGSFFKLAEAALWRLEWDGQREYHQLIGGDDDPEPYMNITRKSNEAREMVLRNGYDAMLMVESDVIVPPDALKRLAAVDADVVYGLAVLRHGWPIWTACTELGARTAFSFSMDPELVKKYWGKVAPVKGVGSCCVLVRRHVLERIEYRLEDPALFGGFRRSCDWSFAMDCQELGFSQACDLGVVCGHIDTDHVPRILWPSPTAPGFYLSQVTGEWQEFKQNELIYGEER